MIQLFRPKYEVEECIKNIREVLESGWTGRGPKCDEIEKEWCKYIGSKYAHYVNSATAGLHIAVRLLDLPKGTKVATTPITFVSTNAVLLYEGLAPVFCDVSDNLVPKVEEVLAALDDGAKAVIWVHYSGSVSEEFEYLSTLIPQKYPNVAIIEDAAHAAGARYADKTRVGSKNNISVFSYHSVKNLPTFDSGMICFPDKDMDERARKLSWLGISKSTYARTGNTSGNELYQWKYSVEELGWKYNANDIAAAIALVQLKVLDRDNEYRRKIYDWYKENLKGETVRVLEHSPGSACHFVVIRIKNRDRIIDNLKKNGIAPGVHYLPNYSFPAFSQYYKKGQCPNTDKLAEEIMTLPTNLTLTRGDVDRISEIILKEQKKS